jgi:hypothetical protein
MSCIRELITLGPWFSSPLDAWMSVCVYSICVALCVGRLLARVRSPTDCVQIKELKMRARPIIKAVEPLTTTIIILSIGRSGLI